MNYIYSPRKSDGSHRWRGDIMLKLKHLAVLLLLAALAPAPAWATHTLSAPASFTERSGGFVGPTVNVGQALDFLFPLGPGPTGIGGGASGNCRRPGAAIVSPVVDRVEFSSSFREIRWRWTPPATVAGRTCTFFVVNVVHGEELRIDFDIIVRLVDTAVPAFNSNARIDDQVYISEREIGSITLPTATGGDGALAYSISPTLPGSLTLTGNILSGAFTTLPTGPTTYTYRVGDSDPNTADTDTDTLTFTIEFLGSNGQSTPMFSSTANIPAQIYPVGGNIDPITLPQGYGGSGSAGGDNVQRYSITPALPSGLTLTGRILTGTPDTVQAATAYTYVVNDGDEFMEANDFSTLPFTIQIAGNQPPRLIVPDNVIFNPRVGETVTFDFDADDPNDDDLSWLIFAGRYRLNEIGAIGEAVTQDGVFTWTPLPGHAGVLRPVTITVIETNQIQFADPPAVNVISFPSRDTPRNELVQYQFNFVARNLPPDIVRYSPTVNEGTTIPSLDTAVTAPAASTPVYTYSIAPDPSDTGPTDRTTVPQQILDSLDSATGAFALQFPCDTTQNNEVQFRFRWRVQEGDEISDIQVGFLLVSNNDNCETQVTARLTGPLTEASLYAIPATTVSLTLLASEYEDSLEASDFTVMETIPGTVTVSGVTRISNTVAQLTLAYSGEDVITNGVLSITVDSFDHTGLGPALSNNILVAISAGVNVCGRTPAVRDAIVAASDDSSSCAGVTDLATIVTVNLASQQGPVSVARSDFAGLDALRNLGLRSAGLTTLPSDLFADLSTLQTLSLGPNALGTLPAGLFDGLSVLGRLDLNSAELTTLNANVFDDLDALGSLDLTGNPFVVGTGLPAGIFDEVFDTLGAITSDSADTGSRLRVDDAVRAGHFVCSHPAADVIVAAVAMADAAVTDCLLVSSTQFNTATPPVDPTLSSLTFSAGVLTPTFNSRTIDYAVSVPSNVETVIVTPIASQPGATITVNGGFGRTFRLERGVPQSIRIEVTAPDGTTRVTYTVFATRVLVLTNVCDRTDEVEEAILNEINNQNGAAPRPACESADLSVIRQLSLVGRSASPSRDITALQEGDFDGLIELRLLSLNGNSLTTLDVDIFDGLDNLTQIALHDNDLTMLPATVFDGLALGNLSLDNNPLTANTGLPAGIFDNVLNTLGAIVPPEPGPGVPDGFVVDAAVRAAHFVCSHPAADGIVAIIAGVDDCLRITTAQFNQALRYADPTLRGLTLSVGTLTPRFNSFTTAYTALVPINVSSVTVRPVASQSGAAITIDGDPAPSSQFSAPFNLTLDVTQRIPIVVTSPDAGTMLTYTVDVTPARALTNICNRTMVVQQAIILDIDNRNGDDDPPRCQGVDLLEVRQLSLSGRSDITTLQEDDFDGLTAMTNLSLNGNSLTTLPADIFDGLSALQTLTLHNNPLTAGTGLPDGIFDDVLNTLGAIAAPGSASGFVVDDAVRAAHFVCSLSDADAVVAATTGVSDCLRITSAQFAAYNDDNQLSYICDRTDEVEEAILDQLDFLNGNAPRPDCARADLSEIQQTLSLVGRTASPSRDITALQEGDFDGLIEMRGLFLNGNSLTTLDVGIFDGLDSLARIELHNNNLTTLPADIFDGLDMLTSLFLQNNAFTPGTGLPDGIFDDVLDSLLAIPDTPDTSLSGFVADEAVRAAHFVCSRDDADAVVAATAGVGDCLRITSAQLTAYAASTGTNRICGRTPAVRDAILGRSSSSDCGNVPDLATITVLNLNDSGITVLEPGDFAGLDALTNLSLANNGGLTTLPAGIFAGLTMLDTLNLGTNRLASLRSDAFAGLDALETLVLSGNDLTRLPPGIFAGLTGLDTLNLGTNRLASLRSDAFAGLDALETLVLSGNALTALPAGIFAGLPRLVSLLLTGNSFTADTGLPSGIFDDVVDTLGSIVTTVITGNIFLVDDTVRDAHFVCSRDDADDIFAVIAVIDFSVLDCLLVTSAQLDAYNLTDATLSVLTVDPGTLNPVFAPGTTNYAVVVSNSVESVTVSANATNSSGATIALNDVSFVTDPASADIPLTVGMPRAIPIVVTAADGATTMTYTVTATRRAGLNICSRTAGVRAAILAASSSTSCTSVTRDALAAIEELEVDDSGITVLQRGDFAGLTALTSLTLSNNSALATLPEGIFDGLTALKTLNLSLNGLASLRSDAFAGLTALTELFLGNNALTALDADVFDGLVNLVRLSLNRNRFTADTGLPDGIFDAVLPGLGRVTDSTTAMDNFFLVDDNVRAAHFVCSRDDAAAILASTAEVTDCLRVTSAQLAPFLVRADTTLSGLAVSGGGTLDPVFDSATTTYAVSVDNSVASVTVTPTATNDAGATITVNGAPVTSRVASNGISLTEGTTRTISIIVTAEVGMTTMTYTVNAIRESRLGNICSRTDEVEAAILDAITPRPADCMNVDVNDLATITALTFNGGGTGITELRRRDFAGLTGLTSLTLSDHALTTLPPDIFDGLNALTSLTVTQNDNLATLPEGIFDGLTALETLDLGLNSLTALRSDAFAGLRTLTTLTLNSNRLTMLPEGIFDGLTALETLGLSVNGLTALRSDAFAGLRTLTTLTLTNNSLDTLPTGVFADLGALTTLILNRNSLDTLPTGVFADLGALTMLSLNGNSLTTLPTGVFVGLGALATLSLSDNSLTTLPRDIFSGLTGLGVLSLENNPLTFLNAGIFDGLRLRSLSLNGNSFTAATGLPSGVFDDVIGTLGAITLDTTVEGDRFLIDANVGPAHFVCSRADSEDIVAAAGVLSCLLVSSTQFNDFLASTVATLRGLTISDGTLEPVFDSTIRTYTVSVANHIEAVTITPTATNGFATVTVGGNPVASGVDGIVFELSEGIPQAISIVVTGRDDTTTETYTVTVTRSATIGPNNICMRTEAVWDAIVAASTATACTDVNAEQLASVTTLSFGGFGGVGVGDAIRTLQPGDFAGLTGLTRLNLIGASDTSSNRLTSLPDDIFAGLTSLESLSLANNDLTTLSPTIFAGLTSLTNLALDDNNQLNTLSADQFTGLTSLIGLSLSNNALTTLPPTIFAGLTSLIQLNLRGNDLTTLDAGQFTGLPLRSFGLLGNDFTAGTGLPAGIFDGPINIQRTDRPDENIVIGPGRGTR